jgi:hypothetical protein
MNTVPIQHVAPAPKKTNKIWIIVIVLLILCCLCLLIGGVAAYFYFQNNPTGISEIFNPFIQPSQPNEAKSGEERRCEPGGFAFKTIPNYRSLDALSCSGLDSNVTLESNDIDFGNPNFVIGEGPEIILDGWALTSTSDPSFENFVTRGNDDMRRRYNASVSSESQVPVAGLIGIAYDYDYDLPGAGAMKARVINVEVSPKQFFFILCRSSVGKWDKTLADFEAVANSITFFEPKPK